MALYEKKPDTKVNKQVQEVLGRFDTLVSTKNLEVLEEFAPEDHVMLIGSDAGEVAKGRQEIEAFFARIFESEETFSWEWERVDASQSGDLAWFFAEGWVILTTGKEMRKLPYRVTGVLKRFDDRWLWMHYHGSEPVMRGQA